jgi:hypothetical protein
VWTNTSILNAVAIVDAYRYFYFYCRRTNANCTFATCGYICQSNS